jgi:hypothetical protein
MIDWNGNGKIDPVDVGITIAAEANTAENRIDLCGYPFVFIQELKPQRGLTGKIKQYDPKAQYAKKATTPLNKYGAGPFCRFSLNKRELWGVKGVYALFDTQNLLYIGQTVNLLQRFNDGYGNIAPRNCYAGGQNTNCKINAMVLQKCLEGEHVFLFFFESSDYDRVEHELIEALFPPYNNAYLRSNTALFDQQEQTSEAKFDESQRFEAIWSKIIANAGKPFFTGGRHLEFSYKIRNDSIISSRAQTTLLTKDNFKNAYSIMNTVNPTEFNKKIVGSSYVKAILNEVKDI